MKLKSLKNKPQDHDKDKIAGLNAPTAPGGGDTYPYGTRMNLDHETLDKLGIGELPKVGKRMRIEGHGRVISASEHSHTDEGGKAKKRRNVELQLEHMGMEPHEPKSAEEAVQSGIDDADGD